MKSGVLLSAAALCSLQLHAGTLPVVTSHPQNTTVSPRSTATLTVSATGATAFQWRFNGSSISGATAATLQITNAQATNAGYYVAIAKNATGWVPSKLAYVSVADPSNPGTVPGSNVGIAGAQANYQLPYAGGPITGGKAYVLAGPQLDQLDRVSDPIGVTNGYFNDVYGPEWVDTVAPGQTVFYRVDITYPYSSGTYTQQSTVLQLVAGTDPGAPPVTNLKFPLWPEWPEPWCMTIPPTNQVRVPGETVTLSSFLVGYGDFGIPTFQWRKDGVPLTAPIDFLGQYPSFGTNATLIINNLQAADAGVYDIFIKGNNWLVTPKISLSVQTANGQGLLLNPRLLGSSFLCDLYGAAPRTYAILCSTNLSDWTTLQTVTNLTGTVTFTNTPPAQDRRFYRASLLP